MRTDKLIVSRFIRKQDLAEGPMVLTIADCTIEESTLKRGSQGVLWFEETNKGLGLNNTNAKVLEAAYGHDTEMWEGRRVRLVLDPHVKMAGVEVGGIKIETPRRAPTAPPGAPPMPVWDPVGQVWITPPVHVASPARPPAPVWDEASQQWITSAPPSIAPAPAPQPVAAPAPPANADGFGPPPPTIAQRVAAAGPAKGEFFDDEIPF